jgi:hypothetical protein
MAMTTAAEIPLQSAATAAESTISGFFFTPSPEGVAGFVPATGAAAASVGVPDDGAVEPPAGAEPDVPVTAAKHYISSLTESCRAEFL